MKKAKIAALSSIIAASILCALPAQADDKKLSPYGTLNVVGIGEYEAAPDEAVLNFQISAQEATASAARDKVEAGVSAFLKELSAVKLPEGAVIAQNLSVSPRFNYKDGKSELVGYQGSRMVSVTLSDFTKIGEVTDLAFKSGINEVAGFSYQLKDPKAAQKKARELAIADAKAKAQELADGFEVMLLSPKTMSFELNQGVIMPRTMLMAARMDNTAGSGADYTVDEITIKAQVSVTYNFKAKND